MIAAVVAGFAGFIAGLLADALLSDVLEAFLNVLVDTAEATKNAPGSDQAPGFVAGLSILQVIVTSVVYLFVPVLGAIAAATAALRFFGDNF